MEEEEAEEDLFEDLNKDNEVHSVVPEEPEKVPDEPVMEAPVVAGSGKEDDAGAEGNEGGDESWMPVDDEEVKEA